uniref:DUF659 domain-containing protein n=1 Tax=Chromera velia CCMP2878 TaxID=1169474 RepID=A0A0G4HG53_9ALVE|mmetsp:Transcript_20931/g.41766  ORF Transcript_20931/g.41766 Transcript_20931/m.41766 type:complete len:464 (+) Transcript_20931:467-1858(+)|eukprot:Cvel_6736.t1-p1 / transcript=Cvel_6736.t1 / gene=Cvel_6736 / organism=Chromera_velia_CCMP2878 / gene_product=hypothetical protein / transcript_product=hypothetical protein / location=Cvel_scaffold337:33192-34671(+) / protein_length=463 / sequence_SO=supercontig / SO=protein_coding / is_pseudo=false
MEGTTYKTIKDVMMKLAYLVEIEIKREVATADAKALLMDGWEGAQSTHYLGVFLRYQVKEGDKFVMKTPLIGLVPHLDETEADTPAHINLVKAMLWLHDLKLQVADINTVAADNTPLNKKFARECCRPFLGCNSHKLNLAIQALFDAYDPILDKVKQIMILDYLKGQKARAYLRKYTALAPLFSNAPRWTIKFNMVNRFFELYKHVMGDPNLRSKVMAKRLQLVEGEEATLQSLQSIFRKLHSVMVVLQGKDITMDTARTLFDSALQLVMDSDLWNNDVKKKFEKYVTSDARKNEYEDPHFETAVVKVIKQRAGAVVYFSRQEKDTMNKGKWLLEDREEEPKEPSSSRHQARASVESDGGNFAARALKNAAATRLEETLNARSPYKDPSFLPGTTCLVKRLFSHAKLIQSDKRQSMDPSTLEMIAFLKINRSYWDIDTVAEAMKPQIQLSERIGSEQFDQRAY